MEVYEGIMQGLQEALEYKQGKGKARTVRMTFEPVPAFEASEIRDIRHELGMTQVLFAGFMGVSVKTVEAWEAGRNMPDGPARRMLSILKVDPELPGKMNIVVR